MERRILKVLVRSALLTAGLSMSMRPAGAQVRSDEEVLLFPTAARLSESGDTWIVPIHGWIFEPEPNSFRRRALISQFVDELDLDDDTEGLQFLTDRTRWLLVDNERGKRIRIAIGDQHETLPPSAKDGHFEETLELPAELVAAAADDGQLPIRVVLDEDDDREFVGLVALVPSTGLTIISDLDDTVKVSEVTNKKRLLRRTFTEPFEAVDGMAERYQKWHAQGAVIWFLSASPWQFYSPLKTFLERSGFPPAVWRMKRLRLADASVLRLFADAYEYKLGCIVAIMEAFSKRQFVLIGDSGEKDPETYGEIARRFPDRIVHIAIRDVTDEPVVAERRRSAFRGVPPELWQVFIDPREVELPLVE